MKKFNKEECIKLIDNTCVKESDLVLGKQYYVATTSKDIAQIISDDIFINKLGTEAFYYLPELNELETKNDDSFIYFAVENLINFLLEKEVKTKSKTNEKNKKVKKGENKNE